MFSCAGGIIGDKTDAETPYSLRDPITALDGRGHYRI